MLYYCILHYLEKAEVLNDLFDVIPNLVSVSPAMDLSFVVNALNLKAYSSN